MPRRIAPQPVPTEEEIRSYQNVPVDVAARYLSASTTTIKYALQQERAPFGFASKNPGTNYYTYHISPDRLIQYQSGKMPMYKLGQLSQVLTGMVEDILTKWAEELGIELDRRWSA